LITNNSKKIYQSFYEAQNSLQSYLQLKENELAPEIISQQHSKELPQSNLKNSLDIAILGHSYLVYDTFINLNLISKLKKVKINVLTAEMVKKKDIERQLKKLHKPLFWTLSKKTVGSAFYFLGKKIDGIIHLTSFECGEDSMIGELIRQESHKYPSVAYTEFVFDEHTGEVGIDTRTEAFLDMIIRRKRYEGNHA
jgi:predicted nucleotide-binding protein (sugar kinase/HSP70/actin superfamily)